MDEKVRERLDVFYKAQEKSIQTQRKRLKEKNLLKWGFFTTEQCDKNTIGAIYNVEKGYYEKKIPMDIPDEEYEKIKKYKLVDKVTDDHNDMKLLLNGTGIFIIIISFIAATLVVSSNPWLSLFIFGIGFVISLLYFALAKIIIYLRNIKY